MRNENIILNSRIIRLVLIQLMMYKKSYALKLAIDTGINYGDATKKLKELKKVGLTRRVEVKKGEKIDKKKKFWEITEKGNKVGKLLVELNYELSK